MFLKEVTRNLFFAGKGGVGKTAVAAAAAIALADEGRKVLLVSAGLAANLENILHSKLGLQPIAVSGVPGLFGLNINVQSILSTRNEHLDERVRRLLVREAIVDFESLLSSQALPELVIYDEIERLLCDPSVAVEFDHILFDTSPTELGMRMLTQLHALADLSAPASSRASYRQLLKNITNRQSTSIVLVSRPELSALHDAARKSQLFNTLGFNNQQLLINGVFPFGECDDQLAESMRRQSEQSLHAIPRSLAKLPSTRLPLADIELLGIDAIRRFTANNCDAFPSARCSDSHDLSSLLLKTSTLRGLTESLPNGGTIIVTGAGGVGKTSVAASVAIALAEKGLEVELLTLEGVALVAPLLDTGRLPNLRIKFFESDPISAADADVSPVLAGPPSFNSDDAQLDTNVILPHTAELELQAEYLREIFRTCSRMLVVDTASIVHARLLVEAVFNSVAALKGQAEVSFDHRPEPGNTKLNKLDYLQVLLVSHPEAAPAYEASQFQQELQMLGIGPIGWVINKSLVPLWVTSTFLNRRRASELNHIRKLLETHTKRIAIIPWKALPQCESDANPRRVSSCVES